MLESTVHGVSSVWITISAGILSAFICSVILAEFVFLRMIILSIFKGRQKQCEMEEKPTVKERLELSTARVQTHLAETEESLKAIEDRYANRNATLEHK